MIVKIRHKGLERYFLNGDPSGMPAQSTARIRQVLALLNVSCAPGDVNLPGLKLHQLKGSRKGQWAVSITGNWRIIFEFQDGNVTNVDFVDYH